MTPIDYTILILYVIGVLSIGFLVKETHLEGYLANSRSTKFIPLLLSTTASWVGSGAIIGVSSEGYKTGISFGLSVILINTAFMLLFAYLAPRIKIKGDEIKAYTVGEYMGSYYGSRVQFIVSFVYFSVGIIWCAVQLLAIAQLSSLLLGLTLETCLTFSLIVSLSYTLVGGLRSDIVTDVIQFIVMLIGFSIMVPLLLSHRSEGVDFSSLPESYFNPTTFGGPIFLIGSVIMGALYPLINVHEWQKVFSAVDAKTARKAYLCSIPLCILFVSIAIFVGLFGALELKGVASDQLLYKVIIDFMPVGVRGLCLASMLALVMSSVDSILIAGSSCLGRDILPVIFKNNSSQYSVKNYRIFALIFGLLSMSLAILAPWIVSLSLFAVFVSLAVAPAILATLLSPRYSEKQILISITLGIIVLISFYPVIGKTVFLAVVFVASLPLLVRAKRFGR